MLELKSGQKVDRWETQDDGTILVTTDQQTFKTKRLIVTAGAWSERLLPGVDLKMKVLRKQQQWFQIDRVDQKTRQQLSLLRNPQRKRRSVLRRS